MRQTTLWVKSKNRVLGSRPPFGKEAADQCCKEQSKRVHYIAKTYSSQKQIKHVQYKQNKTAIKMANIQRQMAKPKYIIQVPKAKHYRNGETKTDSIHHQVLA